MSGVPAMVRRLMAEARWMLGAAALALFGLGWLFVYFTARIERSFRQVDPADPSASIRRAGFLRGLGGPEMDFSSLAIEVALWNHPFIVLTIATWAIARGSVAVAAEIERGTLDLTLSRPVSRTDYLASQVFVGLLGLVVLPAALVSGSVVGGFYNHIQTPPPAWGLIRPALNLGAVGLSIYGYALLLSALDSVRWRPNLIASALTLAGYIAHVVANLPSLEDWKWLDRLSIFKAYDPVEAAVRGQAVGYNAGVLAALGASGIVLAFVAFRGRDLPSNA